MKVLFLDCDDVLNCWETTDVVRLQDGTPHWIPGRKPRVAYAGLDEHRVEYIRDIVKKTGCKIVLSTSWRSDSIFVMYLEKRLGEETAKHIIGKTHDFNGDKPRVEEIEKWLAEHPEVNKFVVLDNSEWDDLERFGRSFVQPMTYKGMDESHKEKVIEVLGVE